MSNVTQQGTTLSENALRCGRVRRRLLSLAEQAAYLSRGSGDGELEAIAAAVQITQRFADALGMKQWRFSVEYDERETHAVATIRVDF